MAQFIENENGKLYAISRSGSTHGAGAIFSLDLASQTLALEYALNQGEGRETRASLVDGGNGLYYCAMYQGGSSNQGSIISFNPITNQVQLVHSFNSSIGSIPEGCHGFMIRTGIYMG